MSLAWCPNCKGKFPPGSHVRDIDVSGRDMIPMNFGDKCYGCGTIVTEETAVRFNKDIGDYEWVNPNWEEDRAKREKKQRKQEKKARKARELEMANDPAPLGYWPNGMKKLF